MPCRVWGRCPRAGAENRPTCPSPCAASHGAAAAGAPGPQRGAPVPPTHRFRPDKALIASRSCRCRRSPSSCHTAHAVTGPAWQSAATGTAPRPLPCAPRCPHGTARPSPGPDIPSQATPSSAEPTPARRAPGAPQTAVEAARRARRALSGPAHPLLALAAAPGRRRSRVLLRHGSARRYCRKAPPSAAPSPRALPRSAPA